MSEGLFDSLEKYGCTDFYPFHMPGHKRDPESGRLAGIYRYDITEIDGFDNLHQPEGIIGKAQERAAGLYGSKETYFLINGSTAGILSAVSAVAERAGKLLIARNCHKAVYHAAFLNRIDLRYVYPSMIEGYNITGQVTAKDLEREIRAILAEEKEGVGKAGTVGGAGRAGEAGTAGRVGKAPERIAGIVITSPTYDGIVSDVKEISAMAHSFGIPLIVDQAHGAHFGMHPAFPESAVREGADIVIHSVHKTLPAPTQTALIHRNGNLTDGEALRKYLRIYQSSSPSYLLMAGIDEAMRIAERDGYRLLDGLLRMRGEFIEKIGRCRYIRVCSQTEPGKLVISAVGCPVTGQMLYDVLRERYHLQMEMASRSCVTAILSMMDREEGFARLSEALIEIDREIAEKLHGKKGEPPACGDLPVLELRPQARSSLWQAYTSPYREIGLGEAEGAVAAEFVGLYPPGIPLLVPGEILDRQMIQTILEYKRSGYNVQGIRENKIKVVE